ncbi:MAG: hypothetical protein HS111_12000 [Kofleriaceae bacterium]|nr:hypothetical protein [Kofleriaceae bacterium]MCL4227264.1 hypothetical protein [Myxococcales bacterium]
MGRAEILCLETGLWWGTLREHSSVAPCLQILSQPGLEEVPHVHRTALTQAELANYLKEWTRPRNARLNVLYLAFHGQRAGLDFVWTSRRTPDLSLAELGRMLERKCEGKVVHLSTCLGFRDPDEIARFVRTTRCLAFSGYARSVDWTKSVALDLLYLSALGYFGVTRKGIEKARADLVRDAGGLVRQFGFQIHTAPPPPRRRLASARPGSTRARSRR